MGMRQYMIKAFLFATILLQGCAFLSPNLEEPTVKINSLSLGKSTGLNQSFNIGLLIANPNAAAIPVVGMKYTLSLNGYDLLSGVTNNIPTLVGYTETPVTIEASADLVSALRLVNSLANKPQNKLAYALSAKLDLKGWSFPLNVTEAGEISLRQ
jgi:LEA14-like dessication related protein